MTETGDRKVSMYAANRLHVDARLAADGTLTIEGQDLNGGEYEYVVTVAAGDVPVVIAALGGAPGDDVLALLAANGAAVVRQGERAWLRGLGLEPRLWGRREPD
ncbi:hypothetical protein [Yinghuangia seranimata]|uniref:hypothetical protein n=1 Tax=Yinghuangia seranimata TaxID=408067 RepID=UPI00248AC22F|nr:hypothetical protein [Yinghuangia seranimata]MDI2125779.1 hypothetical protein [Yinghuangia seranimata]